MSPSPRPAGSPPSSSAPWSSGSTARGPGGPPRPAGPPPAAPTGCPTSGVSAATAYSVVARAYKYKGRTFGQSVSAHPHSPARGPVRHDLGASADRPSAAAPPPAPARLVNSVLAKFSPARPGRPVTFHRSPAAPVTRPPRSAPTAPRVFRANLGGGTDLALLRPHATALRGLHLASGQRLAPDVRPTSSTAARSTPESGTTATRASTSAPHQVQERPPRRHRRWRHRRPQSSRRSPRRRSKLLNGQITTQNHYRFTYGVAAARDEVPAGRGAARLLLAAVPDATTPTRATPLQGGAEIDAVEFFGQGYPAAGWRTSSTTARLRARRQDRWRLASARRGSSPPATPGGTATTCSR